jgi:transposase
MVNRRQFTPEFKAQAVLELVSGVKSLAEACREYQVNAALLSRWKTEFLQNAARAFQSEEQISKERARIAELERLVGRLTLELDIAKKASAMLRGAPGKNGKWS